MIDSGYDEYHETCTIHKIFTNKLLIHRRLNKGVWERSVGETTRDTIHR